MGGHSRYAPVTDRELNVTPQAVYKKINNLKDKLEGLTCKGEKGETLVTPEGQSIIKNSFKPIQQSSSTITHKVYQSVYEPNPQVDKQIIDLLKAQLEIKDKHIETLSAESKQANEHNRDISSALAELNRNHQILLKQAQDRLLPLSVAEQTKESYLKRILSKFRSICIF